MCRAEPAEEELERAVELLGNALGPDHPETVTARANLDDLRRTM